MSGLLGAIAAGAKSGFTLGVQKGGLDPFVMTDQPVEGAITTADMIDQPRGSTARWMFEEAARQHGLAPNAVAKGSAEHQQITRDLDATLHVLKDVPLPKGEAARTQALRGAIRDAVAASASRLNEPVATGALSGTTSDTKDADDYGAVVGVAARTTTVGIGSDRARSAYEHRVSGLDVGDTAGRAVAKLDARAATPREVRAVIEAKRPGLGPQPGSGGRANVSNLSVNQTARALGTLGKGAGVIGLGFAAADVATSDNPARATVANVTAGVAGVLGGMGGAAVGLLGGPAAPVTVPAGSIAGSVAAGGFGYELGEKAYDWVVGE